MLFQTNGCMTRSLQEHFRGGQKYLITMYILCGLVGGVTLAAITIYLVRRRSRLHEKLTNWMTSGQQLPSEEYKVVLL